MANEEVIAVKDAIHKLQLYLLEGIKDENQLFAAGSLLSRRDYQDVVTERSIANMCGYPLCSNSLPSERPRNGHYRISLKEHKVYDLHETYMYCSTNCAVNSGAFARSLQDERSSTLNTAKLNEVLKLFVGLHLHSTEDVKESGDLGLSKLKIQEKVDVKGGEVSMEEWMGPSDAIEGYVPQRERNLKPALLNNIKKSSKNKQAKLQNEKNMILHEMDFSSTIITQDGYSISKLPAPVNAVSSKKVKEAQTRTSYEVRDVDVSILGKQVDALQLHSGEETEKTDSNNRSYKVDKFNTGEVSSGPCQHDVKNKSLEVLNMSDAGREYASDDAREKQSLRSSLKSSKYKKMARSVTWADENVDNGTGKLTESSSEISEKGDQANRESGPTNMEEDDDSYRFESAEACAAALKQAAEAVASGSDVPDAVSTAGIIILPPPKEVDEAVLKENDEVLDIEPAPLKWPRKPGVPNYDVFESEDSWYDSPPEGFNLNLSPFSTMFNSLFTWISSSSLSFIYGNDESFNEEYLSVNGSEYPRKIVLSDGRSTEIKQTLARCLARALPGLVADLRLPVPISVLEQGLVLLIDTMSFVDPLPAFRMKQWQLIVLLFLDALSICRIPVLTPYMTGRRTLLPKVLDGAQISAAEYEILKDLIIPLGRVPQFSMQSGG
ncbi:putative RNA polymerase II subunit B1 CTD phosphatase RPAP2 homolog isoform X1 [Nicotiana tabacum]|uniref:RNA polymerase II subunit B1 CTD phosphatase RPAP2 homolog n=2 Tax=Nicotiana TaxID=4085 RepID=A0A1S4D5B1_TOBAC|nr:PREDICTED: putative RNA polymerase II subunit B1 CTD phosphatase RPAP2 homolog isoform X1 [Nicotiana sylvestris]XP_009771015.1 PREDICTED: putative RNA polymerase II subunit B1 CTD phosphatase RPAP2 homolog isoform X1 [Nicotiana sylvestris]XP_016508615.1 PREDICTED: putative RNA polymerase II subunit B1 CTD phosphatase RPAP2 homolog isoform X1 [Nicotiana tabacum]XP_016508625.1 PREDICTED: putative RNA polymerase II subunit B1 CTD phosphatase RPAP2 homolog isoform X1 [Nicotiana tabacum]